MKRGEREEKGGQKEIKEGDEGKRGRVKGRDRDREGKEGREGIGREG
jgi:hypothetical protein